MGKFVTIGERLSTTAPAVNKAFLERDPEPILKRAKQQLDAGAVYLDVNIGPAEGYGPDLMKWAVQLLQSEFDNVPLALDTTNKKAIEAGISVYNRAKGKPIVNSADASGRIEYVDLAAANDAIVIALCSVQLLCQLRLLASCCILVHQTLCASLVNTLDCNTYSCFLVSCVCCAGCVSLLDHGLQIGLASLVGSSLGCTYFYTLLSRTNIRHSSDLLFQQSK